MKHGVFCRLHGCNYVHDVLYYVLVKNMFLIVVFSFFPLLLFFTIMVKNTARLSGVNSTVGSVFIHCVML